MEDYAVRADKFREAVDSMGVGDPVVNSFATPFNTLFKKFRALQSDALSQSWTGQAFLWTNPPFIIVNKVVTKIRSEQVDGFLLWPYWTVCISMLFRQTGTHREFLE